MSRHDPDESPFQMESEAGGDAAIPPELVRRVADKVYALLQRDMKIDGERNGRFRHKYRYGPR